MQTFFSERVLFDCERFIINRFYQPEFNNSLLLLNYLYPFVRDEQCEEGMEQNSETKTCIQEFPALMFQALDVDDIGNFFSYIFYLYLRVFVSSWQKKLYIILH